MANSGRITRILLLVGGVLAALTSVHARDIPDRTLSATPTEILSTDLVYFIDSDDTWSADAIQANAHELDWQSADDAIPNLGLLAEPVWFSVRVNAPKDLNRWAVIEYSALDDIDVYQYHDGNLVAGVSTGQDVMFRDRPFQHRNYIFPLSFKADTEYLILIRVQTGGALQVPFELWEPQAFVESEQSSLILQVGFAALMLALALYNLLLFFAVRDTAYLWYVGSVVSASLIQVALQGFAYQYLWPNLPGLNEFIVPALISVTLATSAFFTDRFLNARYVSPAMSAICRTIGWLGLALLVFSLVAPYEQSIRLTIVTTFVVIPVLFFVGFYLWWRGEVLARFYLAAWSFFLIGNVIYLLNKMGIAPHNLLTEHAIQLGHSLEVLLLSFALAYRISLERQRRLEAQHEATEKLEERVQERTTELTEAYSEVKRLSQVDGLTGLKNRLFFEECLEQEWNRSARQGESLGLLIVDADYFKSVNDTWGHQCGDACLRFLAEGCQAAVKRPADEVARFGGEEFVLLLPNTDPEGVVMVGERLRASVATHEFKWNGEVVPLTLSVGAACCFPDHETSHETLVQMADSALYYAKEHGRNQVVRHDPKGGFVGV